MADYTYTIFLDAGHGGSDPGAVYNGRREKDDTLALTLAIGDILESYGFNVKYARTEDIYESPYQKAAEGNASGSDIFISIHRNSSLIRISTVEWKAWSTTHGFLPGP